MKEMPNAGQMSGDLELACEDYRQYIRSIFAPAMVSLEASLSAGAVELHQVFGANLFVAHAVDYIQAIRRLSGISESRTELVASFDKKFAVAGGRLQNRKFELIDAINNALKHIRLAPERYKNLMEHYGPITFRSLALEGGRVICLLEGFRFDYVRVVLRPAADALKNWDFSSAEDVLDFARGDLGPVSSYAPADYRQND